MDKIVFKPKDEVTSQNEETKVLYSDVCQIISDARTRLATYANAEVCMTNYYVGRRIKEDVLYNKRADYGQKVVRNLVERLTNDFGKGWGYEKLKQCIRIAECFTEEEIRYACVPNSNWVHACTQLTWSHIRILTTVKDSLARQFYMEMCMIENWSVKILIQKIDNQLFEQTALSKKPNEIIRKELMETKETKSLSPDMIFRSTYFLDMLNFPKNFSENDLESAILLQIQEFLRELGNDFAFLERQKRITVDATDYYLDLLFYHRGLRRLVAIELKLGKFKPEHEGQMLLYLRYLNRHEKKEGEEPPIGLILCSEGNTEHVEYLMLDKDSPIKVAQYYTRLPDKDLLSQKLRKAIEIAREQLEERKI
ncbi:MAG: PDDEXK nuclease domain-containing protein [Bacteroidia bacterium]|nr:PDDEXK nuclease domain-containing protein [Bacteroidia bacterium]